MIKHLKLAGGEEIICDVLNWSEDDVNHFTVAGAFKIVAMESKDGGYRYYMFRPWMIFQEDPTTEIVLNIDSITAVADPHDMLIDQYHSLFIESGATDTEDDIDSVNQQFQEMLQSGVQLDQFDSSSYSTLNGETLH